MRKAEVYNNHLLAGMLEQTDGENLSFAMTVAISPIPPPKKYRSRSPKRDKNIIAEYYFPFSSICFRKEPTSASNAQDSRLTNRTISDSFWLQRGK